MEIPWMTTILSLFAIVTAVTGCYLFSNDILNPCKGVSCGPGALCRPTSDGQSYHCECPTSCPSYGDHEGSRPLCASDARDYPGECEMRRAACETNSNVTFKYYGKCDPCAGVTCPDPEVCQLDDRRAPACRCAEPCPLEFSPVCASDGKTYSNECQMHRESCRARKQLRIIFKGQCSSGVNPCAEVECRHGAECRVEGGGAVCACPPPCEPVLRPVCGSDSRTHDSECELKRAACLLGRELKVLHAGACGSNGVCAGRVCPHGGECVANGDRGICRCPRCSNEFAPVCGSDGISYGNRCKLQLEACRHRRDVQVLYDGPCNGCENKKCEFYAVCESDGVSEASCVCPKHCEDGTETEEICGNDNRTYSSVCQLRDVACRERRNLHVKHMGSCESCAGIKCPPGTWCARGACACANPCSDSAREPVCSNTHRTFPHECALQRAACEARMRGEPPLRVGYFGECTESQDDNSTNGSNKSAKVIDYNNEIHSTDERTDTTNEGSGTAVCARVQCAYEATCAVDSHGLPRCACLFDCAAAAAAGSSSSPVCASDLRLYPTLCHMKLEACRRQEDLRLRPLALCKGLEFRPCGEDEPLPDVDGRPLDCGGGPQRKDCPAGSYCHHTAKAARCCRKDKALAEKKGCQESWHGCCADGVTPARGSGGIGCPAQCGCHRLGSKSEQCDESGQCECRPGVGGQKCDRCEPGYWGLPRIGVGHTGCIPCGCSAFGSVREDCEQMTGRCVCKPGIQGQKCTVCSHHEYSLGPNGCFDPESTQLPATSCEHMTCYFGAWCMVRSGLATCECNAGDCPSSGEPSVCGSDGRTYLSACHLRSHACRTQSDVVVQAFGSCRNETPHVRRGSRSLDMPPATNAVRSASSSSDKLTSALKLRSAFSSDRSRSVDAGINRSPAPRRYSVKFVDDVINARKLTLKSVSSDDRTHKFDKYKLDSENPDLACVNILPPVGYHDLDATSITELIHVNTATKPSYNVCSPKPFWKNNIINTDSDEDVMDAYDYEDEEYSFENEEITQEENKLYRSPLFDSEASLVAQVRLPAKKFDIQAEVTVVCGNGALLTASGHKDHLWLGFVEGRTGLRWNAGHGVAYIDGGRIRFDGRTRIVARRYKKDAVLKVGSVTMKGTAPGRMTSLEIKPYIYIGSPPDNITKLAGSLGKLGGFVGCLNKLRVNGIDIVPPSRGLSLSSQGLRLCTPYNLGKLLCP